MFALDVVFILACAPLTLGLEVIANWLVDAVCMALMVTRDHIPRRRGPHAV